MTKHMHYYLQKRDFNNDQGKTIVNEVNGIMRCRRSEIYTPNAKKNIYYYPRSYYDEVD